MLGVGARHGQEVFAVNEDAASLFDSVGTVRASLLNVPKEFVFNSLAAVKLDLLTFLMASIAFLRS